MIRLPPELLERHGQPGPRYTSYPTAMHWRAAPSQDRWIDALDAALSGATARAGLYVHVPFCQALCTFCGCNMRVARSHSLAAPYVDKLLQEYAIYRERLALKQLPLGTLHLGGGTPTWLPVEQLDRLLDGLLSNVSVVHGAEFTVEADPRNASLEHLSVLARRGFRHVIVGVQDFDERVLQIVNRVQGEAEVRRTIEDARGMGFTSVGVDFIYGLPLQTLDSLRNSLMILLRMRPERVNFLPYAHVPWIKPSQRLYTEADLPDTALRHAMFLLGREMLGGAGYMEIGIDQYALPSDPLGQSLEAGTLDRSFMGFSPSHMDALIGLGVSAIGATPGLYAQNEKNLQRYEARVAGGDLPLQRGHALDSQDRRVRQLIWELFAGNAAALTADDHTAAWWPEAERALKALQADGLVLLGSHSIKVPALGRAFLPQIAGAIDPHIRALEAARHLNPAVGG